MPTQLFAPAATDVLYVVDLSSYLLRAYHAVTALTSPVTGEPTHAVYGTVNMLELLVRERRPERLAIAMDSGRKTFRKEIYAEYKANRPPAPDDLVHQIRRAEEIIRAFRVPVYKQDGVEADDLIACIVARAKHHGIKVVIVAADKDLMQLVSDDVVLWDTMRNKVTGPPEVLERFGVRVDQLRDLLALMGDTSDNIPGVPSVGPKTARDLLVDHGDLAGIYANLDRIPKKGLRETLATHREAAFLSQRLVTLKVDCDIEFDLEKLRCGSRDVDTLRRLYTDLGFTRLIGLLDTEASREPMGPASVARAPAVAAIPAPVETDYRTITEAGELARVLERASAAGRLALHTERTAAGHGTPLAGLALGVEPGRAWYVPLRHRYLGVPKQLATADLDGLARLLADPAIKKVAHSAKRCQVDLASLGWSLAGADFDAELSSYLLDPEARHGLAEIAQRELGVARTTRDALTNKVRGRRLDFDEVSLEEATPFAAATVDLTLRLEPVLTSKLDAAGLTRLYRELELPLASLLAELELRGVLVDVSRLSSLGDEAAREIARLEKEAHRIVGREFNVNSPRQLETLLFDELKLKPLRRTKTSRSTDADTLEALADQHPLPQVILELRQVAKLKGTYIDTLPALIDSRTGRLHTTWEQAVAATGRLSSTDPNLQNIPVRTELGRAIRKAFVAPPGTRLVSADYSQIELRVLAHLSQDPELLDAFRSGQDIHTRTAMAIFDVPADALTREMRTRAKAVNFGVIYGQGDSGLAKALGIPRAEAANFIAAYFRRYQGVRRFMSETLENARAGEAVRSLLGRRRLLPDIGSANRSKRLAAERIAMNMPIQGTAADLLKLAMLALREPVTPGTRMILTVHDELVFEVPDAEVEEASAGIKAAMEGVRALDVPLTVDVGHGNDWNAAH